MVHPAVVGARFTKALLQSGAARVTGRPRRKNWSLLAETMFRFMKDDSARIQHESWEVIRAHQESLVQPCAVASQVTAQDVDVDGLPGLVLRPANGPQPHAWVLYLHGGSYLYGSTRTHFDLMARLALESGARVLGVNYRLAPEHAFPAALEDAHKTWRWLLAQGAAPHHVVVAGDSAGAALAVSLACAVRDAGGPGPAALLLVCPWVDLAARGGSLETHAQYDWGEPWMFERWAKAVAGPLDHKNPRLSPVYANLKGLAPMLIQAGGAEMLLDQEQALAQKAQAAGVDVTLEVTADMVHNWHMFAAMLPESRAALTRAGAFVKQHTMQR